LKLTNFQMPVGGVTGNIGKIGDWWSLLLGGVVMILILGLSVNLFKTISGKVPFLGKYQFEGFAPAAAPAAAPQIQLYGVK
jgi:hypothetical protein